MNKDLWHYTSLEALRGLINKRYLNFWGTRYDSMNDPREYNYAKEKFLSVAKNIIDKRSDIQEADKDYLEIYPYVVSFSRKQDDFLMWRLYKGQIALVLNEDEIQPCGDEHFIVGDCIYASRDELENQLKSIADSEDTDDITRRMQELFMFYKSPDFTIEGEYRIVKYDKSCIKVSPSDNGTSTQVTEQEHTQEVHFKHASDGDIILYKEFHVCKYALKKIVVNNRDSDSFKQVKSHIEAWLKANGYNDVKVEQTKSTPVK